MTLEELEGLLEKVDKVIEAQNANIAEMVDIKLILTENISEIKDGR